MKYPFVEDVLSAKILAKTVPVGALEQAIEEAKKDNACKNTVVAMLAYFARVSNPSNQTNFATAEKLLAYCMRLSHWSVFSMANIVVEVECPRDIGRQILRHRFEFQEFCVAGDTLVTVERITKDGVRQTYKRTIEHLYNLQQKNKRMPSGVRVFDEETSTFVVRPIKEVFKTGIKPVFKITLDNGRSITATKEHKFLTQDGFKTLEEAVGLSLVNGRAVMEKTVAIGCNGVSLHQNYEWMAKTKAESIANGGGLSYIAECAGVSKHTIRKWLKHHKLQYTKKEVAQYTPAWNKGKFGYSLPKHKPETIEKMRNSARRGSESNLWRGGADRSERQKIADWCQAHRTDFLRAAGYKCPCGSKKNLQLHHIQPVVFAPELAYEKSNIQVLCKDCHCAVHRTAGHAKTWRQLSKGRTLTVHWSEVVKVEYSGEVMTYDMEIDHPSHNYVGNGIVTHNSQRYSSVDELGVSFAIPKLRTQDFKNRQNSFEVVETDTRYQDYINAVERRIDAAKAAYDEDISLGVAKETARKGLPEGYTMTRMVMNGTVRQWIHYLAVRDDEGVTQWEHVLLARKIRQALATELAVIFGAVEEASRGGE